MKKVITVKKSALISGVSEYDIRIGLKQGRFPFLCSWEQG